MLDVKRKIFDKIRLTKACDITTGKLDSNAACDNGKYPFFTCAPTPLQINEYAFDDDVILLAGNNAQGNFHLNRYHGKFNAYQRTYIITTKTNNLDYIFYSLKLFLQQFKKKAQGSNTKFLTMEILNNIYLDDVDENVQKKIAKILSALDDKIKLNNKITSRLEQMTKDLYNYWFVQFDFPDGKGRPYKSSGGKMVYNEILKREIPEGWECLKLENRLNLDRGNEFGSDVYVENPQNKENYIKFFRVGDMDNSGNTYIPNDLSNIPLLNYQDVAVSFDGSVGRIAYGISGTYSSGIRKLSDKLNVLKSSSLFFIFSDQYIQGTIQQYASGSNILHASAAIPHLSIPFDEIKFIEFQRIIAPIYETLIKNKLQNQTLLELRDFLLPLLMNGQVTIKD